MNKITILNIAKQYLTSKSIKFVESGELGCLKGHMQEVIFLDPQVLDPNIAIVDPGEIIVQVNMHTKQATLVEQM